MTDRSYDTVPYPSHAFSQCHPDTMGALSRLFGRGAAPPDRARVLEIGCASGGNLLPLACLYPDATFLGIDLSERQIDAARRSAAELGLTNIRFEARDISQPTDTLGTWDYIVAHGVFSWVPRPVQEAIFALCQRHLSEVGVAYLSYNVYPGWQTHGVIRQLMQHAAAGETDGMTAVGRARSALAFFTQAVPDEHVAYKAALRRFHETLQGHADAYILHEFLETVNDPVLFVDFMARAHGHGLAYLGEAHLSAMIDQLLLPEVSDQLRRWSRGIVELEQYLDFLRNRTFRQTLLVRAGPPIDRNLAAGLPEDLWIAGNLTLTPGENGVTTVESSGVQVSLNDPSGLAALAALTARWPAPCRIGELLDEVAPAGTPERMAANLGLVGVVGVGIATLHQGPLPCVRDPGDRPRAWPFSRWQAERTARVATPRSETLALDPAEHRLLLRLDGHTDRAGLRAAFAADLARHAAATGQPHPDDPLDDNWLDDQLARLAGYGVLVGPEAA